MRKQTRQVALKISFPTSQSVDASPAIASSVNVSPSHVPAAIFPVASHVGSSLLYRVEIRIALTLSRGVPAGLGSIAGAVNLVATADKSSPVPGWRPSPHGEGSGWGKTDL